MAPLEVATVTFEVDLVVDVPLATEAEWAGAWARAGEERAKRRPRLPVAPERCVCVLAQARAAENGPWFVRQNGSRRRPAK